MNARHATDFAEPLTAEPEYDEFASQCEKCNGSGKVITDHDHKGSQFRETCKGCDGVGWVNEHGQPLEIE